MNSHCALVFGGRGELGTAIADALTQSSHDVIITSRKPMPDTIVIDPIASPESLDRLDELPPLDSVVWAQGANANDSILDFSMDTFREVMDANVSFVVTTLERLVRSDRIVDGAGLCVLSSIWQEIARQEKLSYTVSKAAIGGLIRSAAVDLAERNIRINAVLPGVVRTPMTEATLTKEQTKKVESQTGFYRLVSVDEVAALVAYLVSPSGAGLSGQSIPIDLGFINAHRI